MLSEISEQLTVVREQAAATDPDVTTIRTAVETALDTIDDHRTESTARSGVIDIETGCRAASEAVGVDNLSVTLDTAHRFAGDQSVVEDLFAGLFTSWDAVGRPVDVHVETTDEQFEIRIESVNSENIEAPADPPELSHAAEALDADIYIARTERGILYLFTGLESAS